MFVNTILLLPRLPVLLLLLLLYCFLVSNFYILSENFDSIFTVFYCFTYEKERINTI